MGPSLCWRTQKQIRLHRKLANKKSKLRQLPEKQHRTPVVPSVP